MFFNTTYIVESSFTQEAKTRVTKYYATRSESVQMLNSLETGELL